MWVVLVAIGLFEGRAEAADSCSMSVGGINFGVYDPTAGSATTSVGTVLVSCSWTAPAPASINVAVSLSTGSSGSYSVRTMKSGSSTLQYNLYFNTNGSTIWGNGTGGSDYGAATITTGTPSGSGSTSGTIYGIVPAHQDVAPGAYGDTIIVTLSY